MQTLIKPNSKQIAAGGSEPSIFEKSHLALIGFSILCLLVVGIQGNFPVNDDFIYGNAVKSIVENGVFRIRSSNAFDFIPIQLGTAICSLTGFSYEILRCLTVGFHLLGVTGIYLAIRKIGLSGWSAAILAACYSFNPIMMNLSLSFMTDSYSLGFTNWAFFFALDGIQNKKAKPFIIASLMLLAAFAVRQTAAIFYLPLAVFGFWFMKDKVAKVFFGLTLLLPILLNPVLQAWLSSGTEHRSYLGVFSNHLANNGLGLFFNPQKLALNFEYAISYLGLFAIPISAPLFLILLRRNANFRGILQLLAIILAVIVPLSMMGAQSYMPYSRNIFGPPYVGCYNIVGAGQMWGAKNLQLLTQITNAMAALLGCCLFGLLTAQVKSGKLQASILFSVGSFALSIAALLILIQTGNFDRYYLLALAPMLLMLAELWKSLNVRKASLLSVLLCTGFAVYGTLAALDSMNFQRAQYQAISYMENEMGVLPLRIDGGPPYNLEHGGMRLSEKFVHTKDFAGWPVEARGGYARFWFRWWPVNQEDYIISTGVLHDYHEVKRIYYFSPLKWKYVPLLVIASDELKI